MTKAIVEAGGRAIVATAGGRLCDDVRVNGGEVFYLAADSKWPPEIIANGFELAKLVRAERIDLIHARSRAPAWSGLLAARRTGARFVTTYHGAYNGAGPFKRLYNSSMVRSDAVIANSAFTAKAIGRVYNVGDRLHVVPRGADTDAFNPVAVLPERVEALAKAWLASDGGGAGMLVLLLPGRLTAWKGHEIAIQAVKTLAGRSGFLRPIRLLFAGDAQGRGDHSRHLEHLVGELGLQDMIRWVGHCDDMPAAYSLCDIVLVPSTRPEAFGRVAVEAGAMGKPVIAAAHGGALETVIDGETGLLTPPGSAAALTDAISRLEAIGAEGREAMGRKARGRVKEHFSVASMTRSTLAIYDALLADTVLAGRGAMQ